MRNIFMMNDNWNFIECWDDSLIKNKQKGELVVIPHAMKEIALHYADESSLWLISGYQRELIVQPEWKNKRIIIRFEGVMAVGELFVNGQLVIEHKGGYTPWEADITNYLTEGSNLLTVKVDSRERNDVPPFGAQIDYLCYNGIYREVSLRIVDPISIQEILISQKDALTTPTLIGSIRIYNPTQIKKNTSVTLSIKDCSSSIFMEEFPISLTGDLIQDIPICSLVDNSKITLWSLDNPTLYQIIVSIEEDESHRSFGFREAVFTPEGFYLNGVKIKLRGLNRHQSFPYKGYAMPARAQKKDADILKYELGLNLVRTSHYPQSPHFLDRCDEIGLLVFEEIPGWQYIGDLAWQDLSIHYVKQMIERDIHHPSIILWGVRINESDDNHDFYTKTNACAHVLDPTRQTGGVRCISHSEMLEDVYTMNDFIQNHEREALQGQKEVTGLTEYVPYMVTEYNGHMYPTKSYDQEERQMEHTHRHYRVIAAAGQDDHICGSIGWCAFDYHTHADFGAGDRCCYHGVMDIFRIPKFAAGAYKAQNTPKPFVQAVSLWARGERSVGGILPLIISTNCDYIKIYFGDHEIGLFFPAEGRYRGIPHPPIIVEPWRSMTTLPSFVDQTWGYKWHNCKIEGYINNKYVIHQEMAASPIPSILEVLADDEELNAPINGSSWDTTRITVIAKDQFGNRLPYINLPLQITVNGGATLIGNNIAVLEGGVYAFWVQTTHPEDSIIEVSSPVFATQKLVLKIK
ncbi:MAG: glycoside hydrolase family 2 TIM barrel-domain containing protein [Brevinema sp.]